MFKSVFCFAVCIVASLLSLPNTEAAVKDVISVFVNVRVNNNNVTLNMACHLREYTLGDGAEGCPVSKYDYTVVIDKPTFPVTKDGITYTAAHHKAFWDWVYAGFGGGGSPYWGENCHGYAFNKGDWPHWSNTLINGGHPCWIPADLDATLADTGGHSAVVQLLDCGSAGIQVVHVYEKFRESGYYELAGACSMPLDMVFQGNEPRWGMQGFTFYKDNHQY